MQVNCLQPMGAACIARPLEWRRALAFTLAWASALWLIALVGAWSADAEDVITPADVTEPTSWGAAMHVTRLSRLAFADQPDAKGFEVARAEGVAVVIDLRAPAERDWDERPVVEKLGLTYYNVPVIGDAFDREAFERIETLVAEHPDEPILLHCSSSNRAGAWLATHLVTRHGLSVEEALAVGRRAGITKEPIELRVRAYLEAPPGG